MRTLPTHDDQRILHCWKEIAGYLSAGVRTVQRWEAECDLPVRRPRGNRRSPVLAFCSELDAWLKTSPQILSDPMNEPDA